MDRRRRRGARLRLPGGYDHGIIDLLQPQPSPLEEILFESSVEA